jgi:peptide deformylase
MALLNVLQYPSPNLRIIAKKVEHFDDALRQLVDDMFETMRHEQGIGLAATQVDVHQRVVVMDLQEGHQPMVFINPEIIASSSEKGIYEEGCLSVRGFYEKVERPKTVTIKAQDLTGQFFEIQADELLAICIQHEIDHLNGKVFVDHLSRLKQDRIQQKISKDLKKR